MQTLSKTLLFLVTLFGVVGLVTTPVEAQPNKGFKTLDLPANAVFLDDPSDALQSDALNGPAPYIDGEERVTCFIGRREGQFALITSNKTSSGRTLCLWDDQDQIDPNPPCGNFSGCRVAKMITARLQDGGVDLRSLGGEAVVPLWVNLHDDRQNFWHVEYDAVRVNPVAFGSDGNPIEWDIDTDDPGSPAATVSRIIDNQHVNPEPCFPTTTGSSTFSFPFHLTVTLQ